MHINIGGHFSCKHCLSMETIENAKIESLNAYYKNPVPEAQEGTPGQQISAVISNLVFYKTLTNIITNFNASSAGFAFESFLAVLLDAESGKQIPAAVSLPPLWTYPGAQVRITASKTAFDSGPRANGLTIGRSIPDCR